jgi:hypothetical protein
LKDGVELSFGRCYACIQCPCYLGILIDGHDITVESQPTTYN